MESEYSQLWPRPSAGSGASLTEPALCGGNAGGRVSLMAGRSREYPALLVQPVARPMRYKPAPEAALVYCEVLIVKATHSTGVIEGLR